MSVTNDTAPDDPVNYSVLGIRIPEDQREKIRQAAKIEERTESSFARFHLGKAADAVIAAAEKDEEPQPVESAS